MSTPSNIVPKRRRKVASPSPAAANPIGRPAATPRSGRWRLTGVSPDPRRAAPRLTGQLDVERGVGDSRLVLAVEDGSAAFDTRVVDIDEHGDWRFEGTVAIDGTRAPVRITGRFHGVFRDGVRETAWWTLRAEWDMRGDSGRRRFPRRRASRRRSLDLGVNAELATNPHLGELLRPRSS